MRSKKETIRKLYLEVPSELLAERLGYTQRSLVELARRAGAPRKVARRKWTAAERERVASYTNRYVHELVEELGRTNRSILTMRRRLQNEQQKEAAQQAPE